MNENQSLACVATGVVYIVAGAGGIWLAFALFLDPSPLRGPALLFGMVSLGLLGSGVATCRRSWPPGKGAAPRVPLVVGGGLLLAFLLGLAWLAVAGAVLSQGHP